MDGADAGVDPYVAEMSAVGHDQRFVVVEKFTGGRARFVVHVEALGVVVVDALSALVLLVQLLPR